MRHKKIIEALKTALQKEDEAEIERIREMYITIASERRREMIDQAEGGLKSVLLEFESSCRKKGRPTEVEGITKSPISFRVDPELKARVKELQRQGVTPEAIMLAGAEQFGFGK